MNTCNLLPEQQLSNLYKQMFTKAEYYETFEKKGTAAKKTRRKGKICEIKRKIRNAKVVSQ